MLNNNKVRIQREKSCVEHLAKECLQLCSYIFSISPRKRRFKRERQTANASISKTAFQQKDSFLLEKCLHFAAIAISCSVWSQNTFLFAHWCCHDFIQCSLERICLWSLWEFVFYNSNKRQIQLGPNTESSACRETTVYVITGNEMKLDRLPSNYTSLFKRSTP